MDTDAYIIEVFLIAYANVQIAPRLVIKTLPLQRVVIQAMDTVVMDRMVAATSNLRRSTSILWAVNKLRVLLKAEMDLALAKEVADNKEMDNRRLQHQMITTEVETADQGGRVDPEDLVTMVVLVDQAALALLAVHLMVVLVVRAHLAVLVEVEGQSTVIVHVLGTGAKEDADTNYHMMAYRATAGIMVLLLCLLVELDLHKATR